MRFALDVVVVLVVVVDDDDVVVVADVVVVDGAVDSGGIGGWMPTKSALHGTWMVTTSG